MRCIWVAIRTGQVYNKTQKESVKTMFRKLTALSLLLSLFICFLPVSVRGEEAVVEVDKNAVLSGLYEADIATIREAILEGVVTSRELTEYYLQRINAYNGPYNCFITICDDALAQADARDAQLKEGKGEGLLFGIPIVIKDNIDVKGVHTTNGHKKQDSQIAADNAVAVQRLLDEGAVILAKTNMCKDARNAHWSKSDAVGETKNPYNQYYSPGGSSGGSSAAVSLNFAAASLGTDTNSSLRFPAALAGCFSLRPTFGLVPREGVILYNSTRDTVGAITRSASDLSVMMDVLTAGEYQYTENLNKDALKGLRLGIVKELTYATRLDSYRTDAYIDDEVAAVFARAVEELKACGAEVVEVSFTNIFSLASAATTESAKKKYYEAYLDVLAQNNLSALIFPTYLSTPLKTGTDENGEYWYVFDDTKQVLINNCRVLAASAKLPEITIPIGYHSGGPGIGMEIAAPRNCEQLLLDIAYSYSAAYNYRIAPAGAPNDYIASSIGSLRDVLDDYYVRLEAAKNPPTDLPVTDGKQDKQDFLPAIIIATCAAAVFSAYTYATRKVKKKKQEEKAEI